MVLPEQRNSLIDDGETVKSALGGAIAWGSLALSRALIGEGRRHPDPMLDELLRIQTDLTLLKQRWKAKAKV